MLAELGYQFPPKVAQNAELRDAVDACVAAGARLADATRRVVRASDADDLAGLATASLELIEAVSGSFNSVNALTSAFSSAAATVPAFPPASLLRLRGNSPAGWWTWRSSRASRRTSMLSREYWICSA